MLWASHATTSIQDSAKPPSGYPLKGARSGSAGDDRPRDTAWTMSQENLRIIHEHIAAFNRGDVEALIATVSFDVEWEDAMFGSEVPQVYWGRDAVRAWFQRVLEPWESIHGEPDEIREASDGRVLVGGVLTVRGKESHAEVRQRGWFVFWVASDTITKRCVFLDRDEALEAAGLSE